MRNVKLWGTGTLHGVAPHQAVGAIHRECSPRCTALDPAPGWPGLEAAGRDQLSERSRGRKHSFGKRCRTSRLQTLGKLVKIAAIVSE